MTRLNERAEAEAELLLQLARQLVEGDVWDKDERRDARILVSRLVEYCRKVCIDKGVADSLEQRT